MEPQKGAIIDASALSYAVWGKVIGIDRSRFNSASITCREEVTFSPQKKQGYFPVLLGGVMVLPKMLY